MTLDSPTNETNIITRIEEELPKSTLYWFFISLAAAIFWTIYMTYYNSRVVGLIVTFIVNKFVKYGKVNIGSFSVSVLSGKIMFRAVHYITEDFSVRIEYGWIIFKWWRPYVYKDIKEDLSHSETRLYSFIDGFEFHVYNRSGTYDSLEKLFGHHDDDTDSCEIQEAPSAEETETKKNGAINKNDIQWRDLMPVCKFDITTCRFVFGNNLVPNTLIVHLSDSHVTYTTTTASTVFDDFMHDLKVKSDSLRVMLVPSVNYTGGIVDEPPRMMGEGFVVMQSADVKLHYYMDQPGTVPYEPEIVALADGETVVRQTYPTMGLDIQCGKNTDFNYGPWADRQREYLWKFFYPSSYQSLVPSKVPASGETRQYRTFELRMNIVAQATIDILFTKYSVTQAVHVSMGQGSYVESSIPWVTEETGYTSLIKGQLLLLEATTSMQFRSLLECETLDFSVTAAYPLEWNAHQDWKYSFTACKATAFLIFQHKHFFSDLIDDWSTKSVPDVYHFVPYTYSINLIINQFELVTLCNEYNWIDTSSQYPENAHIAFCGEIFDLSIQLPYTDFLPLTNSIGFIFKVENVGCRLYLPDNNTSRHVMIAMSKNMKIVDRDGNILDKPFCYDIDDNKQWRRLTQRDTGWIDCWQTSNVALSITYKYYPMPPLLKSDTHHIMPAEEDLIMTDDPEEALLIPLRPMRPASMTTKIPDNFDAGEMDSDLISVELEVAPSVICVYGSLLRNFLHVKENYLGEDQHFTDLYDQPKGCSVEPKSTVGVEGPLTEREVAEREFDARKYRPFAVTVSVTLHDIQGHLVKNCNMEDVPCPSVYVERLGFEMDKNYNETRLQVLISPAVLIAKDNIERESDQIHLKEGHLALSGLQVRGHAMFSHKGLALESETLEYAWLVEAIIGDITGKLTSPQIQNIVESLQTFVMLVEDPENSLQRPLTYQLCQHMTPQPLCKKLQPDYTIPCPSSEDIKYRMTRASVDCINIFVVEGGTAMNLQLYPLRLSTCNLHGNNTRAGINCLIEHISLRQFISTAPIRHDSAASQPEVWLESGGFSLGPINAEAAMALPSQDFHNIQDEFLKLHDYKTNRLWFLWPGDGVKVSTSVMGKCGCLGGCVFFGNNRNGISFFHPKKFRDVTPTAVCKVSPDGMDPGFGQSLLHKNKLIFDIGDSGWLSPTRDFAFTRGYMSSVTTPDTPVTSITVVEEISASPRHVAVEPITETIAEINPQTILPQSPTEASETPSSSSVVTTSPSEVLSRESVGTNPFDTVRSIDSVTLREGARCSLVEAQGSSFGNLSLSSSQSPPPFSPTLRSAIIRTPSSRSSGQSPSGRSSVTSRSPSLVRRMRYASSHHDPQRQISTVSLESEMYYSAEEDAYSSSDIAVPPEKMAATSQEIHSSGSDSVHWGTLKPDPNMKLDLDPGSFSTKEETVLERKDSSSSLTNSTLSYMSADTDPDETLSQGLLEDELSMVDLHGQVNKPITKSPVLLPCYSGHLTRLHCSNWSTQSPFPAKYHGITVNHSSYQSLHSAAQSSRSLKSTFVPHFVKTKQGFSTRIMRAKEAMFAAMEKEAASSQLDDSTISDTVDGPMYENTSRTTATVKLKGSLDVLVTPLLLESLQRFCEAVTPALTILHPSAILDNLHFRCLDQLKSQNRLKKAEDSTDPDTPDTPDYDEGPPGFEATQRQFSGDGRPCKTVEVKTSSYQALLTLSRINICMLQAGMVEEKISFSALDNISELTCVSLIGISIDNIRCQLLSNSHSCKTTKDILPNVLTGSPSRNKTIPKDGKPETSTEVEKDNVPEVLREEDVGTLHLNSVHLQLRRLLRDGHISEDVILTAIPEHKSKVMFSFENDETKLFSPKSPRTLKVKRSQSGKESVRTPSFSRDISHDLAHEERKSVQASIDEENPFDAAPAPRLLRRKSKDSYDDTRKRLSSRFDERHSIGFIMFECGLEDISISAVRRLGYKEKSDIKFDKSMAEVHQEAETMEASTRAEVEGQGHTSDSQDLGQGQSSSQSQGHTRSSDSSKPSIRVGSQELYPSSNSVHSWDSRVSIPSDASLLCDEEPLKGDASSGTLHLKTIWFNFAAPPPLPIKRKADFTKKDWNLLSTATPAINAWMSPFDRLMTAVRTLVQELTHRTNSVMACIMTEGLEVQSIHMPLKSKYMRNTNFSRTLQEDASCQMLTVLRRYLHMVGTSPVEQAVVSDTIPQLITIQKGILALTRQWKNVLYMPQLSSKFNFKSRRHRPYTVSLKLPTSDYEDDDDATSVNLDVVDERASLIDGASIREAESIYSLNKPKSPSHAEISSMVSGPGAAKPQKKQRDSRYLQIQKALFDFPKRQETNPHMTSLLRRDESIHSIHSEGRGSMADDLVSPTPPATPYKGMGVDAVRQKVLRSKIEGNQDLYRWMAAQQEGFHTSHTTFDEDHVGGVRRQDSFLEAFGRGLGQEDSHTDINIDNFTMGTSIMQLADAQNLFKPFLMSIGLHVESVRPTAMMKKFGGNLSLQGRLDVLKIEIADSVRGKGKGKGKKRRDSKFVDTTHDTPAFLCEKFTLNISMRDVEDFEKKGSVEDRLNKLPFKFAMHKLEAKPATLQVNLMVNCQSVTQHVDMPLLRLIHQFVTVIDNVNETRIELKQGHSSVDWIRTHRKQDSKGSSSSADTQQSDSSRTGFTGVGFPKAGDSPVPSKSNLAAETKLTELPKPTRTHKPSISSFKFPFDSFKSDLTSTLKKSRDKFTRDSKKVKDQKSSGGHSQVMTPPQSLNFSDSVNIDMGDYSSPAVAEKTFVDEIKESTPKCWRTLYHLLELYSTMPETKTVSHRPDRAQLPVIEEEAEKQEIETPSDSIKTRLDVAVEEEVEIGGGSSGRYENTPLARSTFSRTRFKQSIYIGDSIPLVVFGIAKLEKVKILAVLSGLKLEGELRNVHASGTIKEKVKGFLQRKSSESSVTAHVGSTHIVLLEGPSLQTVVTIDIARSQGLHTTVMRRGKGHNSALVSVGAIDIDIPQHPVVLHGMLTRGTRQMSTTLQEFRRPIPRSRTELPEFGTLDSRSSGHEPQISTLPRVPGSDSTKGGTIHIHLKAILQGITIGASLLPSLKAQHKTGPITITGVTVKKARFTLDLPSHTLSFKSKVTTMETSIPSSASIDLPPIHIYADYRQYRANGPISEALTEGLMLKEGNYLNGVAEVGMFEHSLTTDLLNHLVFVQKVFMKEVNELLQKVSGSDKPVPIWTDTSTGHQLKSPSDHILYSFLFRLKGIQITATTPTASAVRLETEAIDLEVSNRVQMASREANPNIAYEDSQKVFIKAQVDLNVALGQLLKNPLFEEADPEFQTMAFFKTKIGIRNALQDEMIPGVSTDQEALLINLTRPIVLAQPMAFDKAVLVWLNYKNAYEYWTEQRLALNKEVQTATQQVMDRLPQISSSTQEAFSTLFLQLTVDDIGLCLPIQAVNTELVTSRVVEEPGAAVVLTIESTQITACSSGSLVSKGKFTDFCLRIAEDFETSLDDWKPSPGDLPVMNACVVPEGTYEVCSTTINKQTADSNSNAKWILNIKWEMQGIDVHIDTNIGKTLSALGSTLTTLTGEEDEEFYFGDEPDGRHDVSLEDVSIIQPEVIARRTSIVMESLPKLLYDTTVDPKQRARLIEKEMNEQAKVVQDLKDLGASQTTIDAESRKLEELKSIIFHEFRKEVLNRLKKQSEKASVIKDKLGIGSNPAHMRSRSFGGAHEKHRESAPSDLLSVSSKEGRTRGVSDTTETLASKVQFGETTSTIYTPPLTPEDTPQHVPPGLDSRRAISLYAPSSTDKLLTSSSSSSIESSSEHTSDETSCERVFQVDSDMGRRSGKIINEQATSSNPSIGSGSKSVQEPNVDFELVVKVFIDSGNCVLHPKDSKDDEHRKKRDKTPTPDSPPGKRKMTKSDSGSLQGGQGKKQQAQQSENTVFFLPGVDVKVHYNSKTDPITSPSSTLTADASLLDRSATNSSDTTIRATDSATSTSNSVEREYSQTSSLASLKRQGIKKASLYAWLSLQPLPEETFLSPYLLDFLEQALEPIPISLMAQSKKDGTDQTVIDSVLNMDLNASSASIGSPALLGSFPVDVVVLIRVEPSVIRVNCLPTSRVECLLKIPSLELVFSTKRSDVEACTQQSDGTPPLKAKFNKMKVRERNLSGGRDNRNRTSSTTSEAMLSSVSSGGLSVTACLSDFSLYIFHPYGGGQGKPGGQVSPAGRILGSIQEQSVLGDVSRKDSLSLKVEFINLNISRSRKLEVKTEGLGLMDKLDPVKSNVVRFSAVCDIGSAAFKYDMRRLSEILSFPKSWYRRNLARRLFLGDESGLIDEGDDWSSISSNTSSLVAGDGLDVFTPNKPHTSNPSLHVHTLGDLDTQGHHRRGSSGDKIKIQISPEFRNELADRHAKSKVQQGMSVPQSPTDAIHGTPDSITMASGITPRPKLSRRNSHPPLPRHSSTRSGTERKSAAWQTLVLYAVNLSRLDVHVNMSNVMGNTVWNTKDIKSQGSLSIDSSGHKNLKLTFGLSGSHFDSKGGVVGGNVDLQDINTHFEVSEDPKLGKDPLHRAGLSMYALEGRVDYMGSSILMTRLSDMTLTLRDEWKIDKVQDADAPLATTRAALLFAHGDLGWDKFHILISRSTTPDLIKIAAKLEEFIMQQFTSSRRLLGAMGPIPASVRHKEKHKSEDEESFLSELRHHRHWQKALENITGCHFTMLPSMLPTEGMILGGNLTLQGQNLSLACFHGINFRSKAWAIFTMNDVYISFATEAQKTQDQAIHVVQDLTFFVGRNQTHYMQGTSMAHVLKLSRGHMMPPTFTHASEWFHYAFATSEVKDLDKFPTLRREGSESPSDYRKSRKYADYAHETEVIFALPPMQLHLVTKHNQAEYEPMEDDPKPVVECSFITEFEDHTLVAMDAEVILFLHDLIASYIREKDKGSRASTSGTSSKSAKAPQEGDKKKMTDPLTVLQQDWREYQCITWQLEPTVRLLHWASKQIDPVGVDYVLQKLGFTHARVTIPKWMQRGFMDPSDKIISMLVNKLITVLRENPESKQ